MTDAQIEAVARAMWERDLQSGGVPYDKDIREDYRDTARAAIAAYEATRPAVATDEELADVFADAVDTGDAATTTNGALVAGIRAVRERLALALPEWTRRISITPDANGQGQYEVVMESYDGEGHRRIGTGPTIADAIRDAVGGAEG